MPDRGAECAEGKQVGRPSSFALRASTVALRASTVALRAMADKMEDKTADRSAEQQRQLQRRFNRPLHASLSELRTTGRFQPSLSNKATADRQARKEHEEESAALGARKTTGLQSRRWFCVNRAISKYRTPGSRSPFVRIVSRDVFPRRPDSVKTSRPWRPSRFNVFGFLVFPVRREPCTVSRAPCAVNRLPARRANLTGIYRMEGMAAWRPKICIKGNSDVTARCAQARKERQGKISGIGCPKKSPGYDSADGLREPAISKHHLHGL